MPMLHPCPRCTQALPASAKFCRRCGAAMGPVVSPAILPQSRKRAFPLTEFLAALVICAAVVAVLLFFSAWHMVATPAVQTTGSGNSSSQQIPQSYQVSPDGQVLPASPQTVFVPGPIYPEHSDPRFPGRVELHPTEQELRRARERDRGR